MAPFHTPGGPTARRPMGAHMSTAGSLLTAVGQAAAVGADALQIFTKSQLRWMAPPIRPADADAFRRAAADAGLRFVCAHAGYLANLASPSPETRAKSLDAIVAELERADALGCACLVMHPGSSKGDGLEAGVRRVAEGLSAALARTEGLAAAIALENTAGQGGSIGADMAEIEAIVALCGGHPRLRLCLDTCHAFAAGYDIRTPAGAARLLDAIAAGPGLQRLMLLHANDSKKDCGARVDRHEHIAQGFIGPDGFRNLFSDPRLDGVPGIIETPKDDATFAEEDSRNLARLVELGA